MFDRLHCARAVADRGINVLPPFCLICSPGPGGKSQYERVWRKRPNETFPSETLQLCAGYCGMKKKVKGNSWDREEIIAVTPVLTKN